MYITGREINLEAMTVMVMMQEMRKPYLDEYCNNSYVDSL